MSEESEIRILSRKSLTVTGAESMIGFSDREAVISTNLGILAVTGDGLTVDEFNRTDMAVSISGNICAVFYPGNKKDARGFFKRAFGRRE